MRLHHVGIEVQDVYEMERFYRIALGFSVEYRYVSQNTPGLRTVFLRRGEATLELLERPRPQGDGFLAARAALPPNHVALEVDDVDAAYVAALAPGLPGVTGRPPRATGDGFREAELRDPEGNVVELSARVRPPPAHPVRAVLFDLDGTLVDSEPNYLVADQRLLAPYGIAFTEEDKRRYVGGGNLDQMIDLRRRFDLPATPQELAARKNALYLELALRGTPVFPEMLRFLERVRARGLPVAVASGSSPEVLRRVLEAAGLAAAFPVVVSAEEVARGKPWPEIFLEAAGRLGVPPTSCLVIEDSRHGVVAARRAFMRCIAVPYLSDPPLAVDFQLADLLFERGMAEFDAARALAWLEPLLG